MCAGAHTEVGVHDDGKLWTAEEEGRDQAPYLRRQAEEPVLGEIDPRVRHQAQNVSREGRDDNGSRKCPSHWRRRPVRVHDFRHGGGCGW